ncbi:MAG: DNA-protecting protein DprA [Deltaproteobacteria bacterium]|jgi:DNA processing protein|nr:DNA-protecting protein DprA [Deltaproteobacteria bacterium]
MAGKKLLSWLTLHLVPGLGPVTCNKLVNHFGSPENVLAAGRTDLAAAVPLRQESLTALRGEGRRELEFLAEKEIEQAEKNNIAIIPCDDPHYPPLLKKIHDPPVILYVKGIPESLNCTGMGIVGSRAATSYGKDVAGQLADGLATQGFTVISGMALGIDTAAHKGALAAGGKTIAVLGCGLDIVYPPSNHDLFKQINAAGAVVSEYPFGTEPEYFRFPARNRIISGLSLGVVVVEAATRSGSLITANHALEQGREVFAVPGRIDSVKSAGTHSLLQQGAKLVLGINDIIEEFPETTFRQIREVYEKREKADKVEHLSREEAQLYGFIEVYPLTFDEIVLNSGFSAQQTNELLLLLELKGLVEPLPGKSYQRNTSL